MMFQVSDYCKIRDVSTPNSNDDQDNIEFPRKKINQETEGGSSSGPSCFVAHITASTDTPVFLPQEFTTSSDGLKRKCHNKCSPKRIISSNSSMGTRFLTFTLAPVDVRHCRLRLPVQFSRENGINKPGKIYLSGGNDGSKWLANLLLESRGRFTVGDGWKSFVKANGLKIGESYTLELNWEDTTPVLSLCHCIDSRPEGECSQASEKESSRKEGSSSSTASQNRFLTLTITPDSLRHGRLRLPLEFMTENGMDKPGDITLLGIDGAKWLVSLLLERRGRMCLGKGWKDFGKANGLKTGDSITLESLWEDSTPVLRLLRVECRNDRTQQGECSKAREEESALTEPSSGNKTRKAERNREESRLNSSLAIQNKFAPEIVRPVAHDYPIGEIVVFRDEGDMMFYVSDVGPRYCEIQDVLTPSSNNGHENIGSISIKMQPYLRKEPGFSLYDGDDQYNIELPRKKKVKKNNPGTEADSSSGHSCFVAHATTSNLHTDALHLPQDLTSSDGLKINCGETYSSSEKQLATFTLAPVDVRNCRLRLPMQFTRENGINKPGKIYLLGKDGSKWLANLLLESRGRMTLGDGWKSFVKANGLKTGESFALKLNWEDTTPVLSLCPAESSIDSREGSECPKAGKKEPLSIVPSSGKEMSKDENNEDENRKKKSSSWERETNLLILRDSTVLSQNRFLTLTITPDSLKHGRLRLPLEFMTENGMNNPGDITLLGKDGVKWLVSLLLEKRGRMSLGKGWKDFAKANGLKIGDSITLESIWEYGTPVLSLLRVESSNDREQSEGSKQYFSTGHSSGNKTRKAENNRDSSSAIENRIVILTLTHEDVRDCKLQLPSQFVRSNGIMKPGKITLLGRSGMKWFAYLQSKDGKVALEYGWKGFCEANGVMVGESFVLEFIVTEDTNHVFKFYSNYGDQIHKC